MLLMKRCSVLPVKTQDWEEADTCTCIMIILHCLNIRVSLPEASTIIVTSKDPRHRCISTPCTILQGYTLDSFVQHLCGQKKGRFLNVNNIGQNMWGTNMRSLNSHKLFLQAVKLPVRCVAERLLLSI